MSAFAWGQIKTHSLDFWPGADRAEINTPIRNMIAYLIYVFAASKINFNISNETTFAMHHQGPSILDDRLPPDSPFIENTIA